jgi:ribosomal protein S18 acetylase RimI-like enzyme
MLSLRNCKKDDFDQVYFLLSQLWKQETLPRDVLLNVYDRALASALQTYVCASNEDNQIVGFCSLSLKNNLWQGGYLAHIDELIVDVKHRGQGIGGQLLDAIIKIAIAGGCRRIELDSAFHRKEAHEFYARRGFEKRAYLFSKCCG